MNLDEYLLWYSNHDKCECVMCIKRREWVMSRVKDLSKNKMMVVNTPTNKETLFEKLYMEKFNGKN